jgi:hypothetical protein
VHALHALFNIKYLHTPHCTPCTASKSCNSCNSCTYPPGVHQLTPLAPMPPPARRGRASDLTSKPAVGRVQRWIRRWLIFVGRPMTTVELARLIYRRPPSHPDCWTIRQSALKFAVPIGRQRSRGGPMLWRLRDE